MTEDAEDAEDGRNAADAAESGRSKGRFSKLPPRIAFDDMVEVVAAEDRAPDNTPDPNREVAWKYGLAI